MTVLEINTQAKIDESQLFLQGDFMHVSHHAWGDQKILAQLIKIGPGKFAILNVHAGNFLLEPKHCSFVPINIGMMNKIHVVLPKEFTLQPADVEVS